MSSKINFEAGRPFSVRCSDGAVLRCQVDGIAGAPWILFSNSHATVWSMWDDQVRSLSGNFSILRYDQRGHGKSTATPDVTFDRLAEDIDDIFDAVSIERAALVGVSMGAVTTLRFAARFPRRVTRVVACDGQWRSPAGASKVWDGRIATARSTGMDALAETTVARWFPKSAWRHSAARISDVQAMIRTTPINGYVYAAMAMRSYDFRQDYPHIQLPVHFVAGACDGALLEAMRNMHAATPGSTFDVIPDSGHLPPIDNPEAVNHLLARYLLAAGAERREHDRS
ncbi:hypothetical protein ATN79_47320 [Paraburkholderia caribensis]|nr:hypothetical protein ATN79_47320 [Paraburkholderia caribensis]